MQRAVFNLLCLLESGKGRLPGQSSTMPVNVWTIWVLKLSFLHCPKCSGIVDQQFAVFACCKKPRVNTRCDWCQVKFFFKLIDGEISYHPRLSFRIVGSSICPLLLPRSGYIILHIFIFCSLVVSGQLIGNCQYYYYLLLRSQCSII